MTVFEFHLVQHARPHVVTVTVDLEMAFERVACADSRGEGYAHAPVVLLLDLPTHRGTSSLPHSSYTLAYLESQLWCDELVCYEIVQGSL